jgi:hypothetical protein
LSPRWCASARAHRASLGAWLTWLLLVFALTACRADAVEESVGVGLTGLDHLAEHLSIQDFSANGTHGHQAGRGGSTVCCLSLPLEWRPGSTVKVQWAVTNWKRRVYSEHEADVPLEKCDGPTGRLWVHFLADGRVRAITCDVGPGLWERNLEYPGPQPLATVLVRKQPWKDYQRQPGEPEFPKVDNAMEGGS